MITECPVLHDISHVVQFLIKKAEAERVETDQCYEVLMTINSLWKKDPKVSLQQWYADSVEKINAVNEVSTTFESRELFVIPTCFIETMFKVHAIREGHQELLKRVARRNGGLVPLAKLHQELQLAAMADGGVRAAEDFSAKTEDLFEEHGRRGRGRGRGQAHATEGEGAANATEGTTADRGGKGGSKNGAKEGGKGRKTKQGPTTVNVSNDICFNYQSGKCNLEQCPRVHQKVVIPNDFCKNHLVWRNCEGPPKCTRTHSTWPEVIKHINAEESTAPSSDKPQQGGVSDKPARGRSKRPRERRHKEEPPSTSKGGVDADAVCHRCGKKGHKKAACYASFDSEGKLLDSEKPAPVPDAVKHRKSSVKKKGEANAVAATQSPPDNGGFFLITNKEKGGTAQPTDGTPITDNTVWTTPLPPWTVPGAPPSLEKARIWKMLEPAHEMESTPPTPLEKAQNWTKKILANPAKVLTAVCVVPTAMTLGKNLKGVWKVMYALSILMLFISLIGSELMENTDQPPTLQETSILPPSTTTHTSNSVSVTKGTNNAMRKVLVDSGANIMLAPNDINMTNVRRSRFNVTGVNGNSSTEFVGQLPTMVTNTGHHLHFDADCPISLPEHANSDRTIMATRYLNDMGLTVVFQNHTTVLLKTSSVRLSGVVVHQEAFSDNLAYIHLQDNGVPRKSPGRVQVVNTTSPPPPPSRSTSS